MQNPPPVQVSSQPPVQTDKSSTGLDENLAALLSYVFGWISGLVFFLIEKNSRLVRFHAMQSLLLNAAALVIGIVFWIVAVISSLVVGYISGILGFIVWIVMVLVGVVLVIGLVVAAIISLIKAYQGQYFKLPVIGNYAEKFSAK
ncbi:MAG TPA: hypothetical protein VGC73_04290 [Pyrinomonadaceae bacterium]|jgi:uncharacterized membrane protein